VLEGTLVFLRFTVDFLERTDAREDLFFMNIERRDPKRFVDPPSVPNAGASPNGPCIIFISDSEENKILHFSLAPSRSSSDCLTLRSITLTRARQQLKIQNEKRTVA
jgi:hypothetical protein